MGFFDNFQYTNFHELNLDWLLKTVAGYEDVFKEIKEEWQKIWDMIDTFPNDMYKFAAEFNQKITKVENAIKELGYLYNNLNYATPEDVAEAIENVTALIETNIVTLKSDIAMLYTYIDNGWVAQKRYIDRQDKQLNDKIDSIVIEAAQDVINPFTNIVQSIQETLNYFRTVLRFFAFTAREYDTMYWTAEQYDKCNMSAIQYDTYAKFLYGWWPWKKPSAMCLTAAEYDSLELTAESYGEFELSAWKYDERSLWYLGNAPVGNYLKYTPNKVNYN